MQPRMMFGMASLHSNQAEAAITPSMGHAGSAFAGQSNFDSSQIPRPISNSAVILHETRQGNKANPPPVNYFFIAGKKLYFFMVLFTVSRGCVYSAMSYAFL